LVSFHTCRDEKVTLTVTLIGIHAELVLRVYKESLFLPLGHASPDPITKLPRVQTRRFARAVYEAVSSRIQIRGKPTLLLSIPGS
jgi:hypothetical protein